MKNAVGTDLTKFCMPVWINEPITTLMKPAECGYYVGKEYTKASFIQNPAERTLNIAIH